MTGVVVSLVYANDTTTHTKYNNKKPHTHVCSAASNLFSIYNFLAKFKKKQATNLPNLNCIVTSNQALYTRQLSTTPQFDPFDLDMNVLDSTKFWNIIFKKKVDKKLISVCKKQCKTLAITCEYSSNYYLFFAIKKKDVVFLPLR